MTYFFYVEIWNRTKYRYDVVWEGKNRERAFIQAKKSYITGGDKNKKLVRIRKIEIETKIIYRNDVDD